MHARLFIMNLGPGMRETAISLADGAFKLNKTLAGFVSATYLILDEARGEYASLTVWRSEADATAAAEKVLPWFEKEAGSKLKAPPVVRLAEVYEPK